jgi:hypothetical protein
MSTLWEVEVAELTDTKTKLRVTMVHPDASPYATDAMFVLQLLYDTARVLDDDFNDVPAGPLGETVAFDALDSEKWIRDNGARFIASAWIEHVRVPAEDSIGTVATYVIEVTDPRWIAHLRTGQCWDSAAWSALTPPPLQ